MEMSGVFSAAATDVLTLDATDVFSEDTTDVLSAAKAADKVLVQQSPEVACQKHGPQPDWAPHGSK